jgi:Flp pilus assembly protein TadG
MSLKLRLPRWARHFAGDARGVSAVEFALVLPLMMTLYLGGTEVSQAITASRKVTLVSRTVADLVSQYSSIGTTDVTNILNAGAAIIAPFSSTKLAVTVSCVKIDSSGNATVAWSDTLGGTKRGVGSSVTLPSALAVPNTSLIFTEATYDYKPTLGYVITGSMALKDQMYMRPRLSDTVTRV